MSINIFNTSVFLQSAGLFGLFIMIFAETGLLIGLILPGESLLLTAGFLSSIGDFNIWLVLAVTFVAAVLADSTGYVLGKHYGIKIFSRKNSLFFDQEYINRAENFYQQHGGKTVIIGRFVPFFRTIVPILAGVGSMKYSVFLIYNLVGALVWSCVIGLLGFYLGKLAPTASKHGWLVILFIAVLFLIPMIYAFISNQQKQKN